MTEVLELFVDRIDTPIGEMLVVSDPDGNLRAVDWTDYEVRMRRLLCLHYGKSWFRLDPTHDPNILTDAIAELLRRENSRPSTLYRSKPVAHLFSVKCGARCAKFAVA